MLEAWMQSYKPQELFNENGQLIPELAELAPKGDRRMGANPNANGGKLLKKLDLPDFKKYAFQVTEPGKQMAEATRQLGKYLRDVFEKNERNKNFRIFCPDETNSNRLGDVFEVTDRCFMGNIIEGDDHLSPDGRVLEVLSEHCCQGWLEGYLLTGRHGLFPCYEAFITIIDSMVNQYAKWLKTSKELPWRKPIASLNYLLTSHAWRQDHNGYSHQGPGFINTIVQKKSSVARIYLPPDGNCLLSVMDHCLQSLDYINLIICGKQPEFQWLDMDSAIRHCQQGASVWQWASNDKGDKPDIVMACAGDVPTMETLAAVWLLRNNIPELNVRVVNVVDLMTLLPHNEHPHGLDEGSFKELFTNHIPVIFAFHGYPRVIHELIYKRPEDERFHVHGYIEEGTTTTPFDMTVCNSMSRYHLAIDTLQRVPRLRSQSGNLIQKFKEKLQEHHNYITQFGEDMPEIRNWKWS
jgi:xylulose-5-phosphate/fructose-6-phosphate phosphoketolase